jgi:hypothetical protein
MILCYNVIKKVIKINENLAKLRKEKEIKNQRQKRQNKYPKGTNIGEVLFKPQKLKK